MIKKILHISTFSLVVLVSIVFSCNNKQPFNQSKILFDLAAESPSLKTQTYNIPDFGAKPDSVLDHSDVLRFSIDSCHRNGRGKIIIPKGKYFTGAIHLKSNVPLSSEDGVKWLFANIPPYYLPAVFTRWEELNCCNYSPLINANNYKKIGINGNSELRENGSSCWSMTKEQGKSFPSLYELVLNNTKPQERMMVYNDSLSYLPPSFIQFVNYRDILSENSAIMDNPTWTIHQFYSKDIIVSKLKVITNGVITDGIIPISSNFVLFSNFFFSTGEDHIKIKPGLNEYDWRIDKSCKNIAVTYCFTAKRQGGVVLESEISCGVENVFVNNCEFRGTGRGIRIKGWQYQKPSFS